MALYEASGPRDFEQSFQWHRALAAYASATASGEQHPLTSKCIAKNKHCASSDDREGKYNLGSEGRTHSAVLPGGGAHFTD